MWITWAKVVDATEPFSGEALLGKEAAAWLEHSLYIYTHMNVHKFGGKKENYICERL